MINSFSFLRLYFSLSLEISEFLFVFSLPRRRHFALRLVAWTLFQAVYSFIIPLPQKEYALIIIFYLSIFLISIGGLFFSFRVSFPVIIFCAVGGFATNHISSMLNSIVYLIDPSFFDQGQLLLINYYQYLNYFLCSVITYPLIYFIVIRKISLNSDIPFNTTGLALILLFSVIICLAVGQFFNFLKPYMGSNLLLLLDYIWELLASSLILLVLYFIFREGKATQDSAVTQALLKQKSEQYQMSKESIDVINQKCHDLKYQILAYQKNGIKKDDFKSIADSVGIYDCSLKTGNDALDVLLTEKSLYCEKKHIRLEPMVDGSCLSFMKITDIYVLFGNLLDNAIAAVEQLPNAEKRIISLTVMTKNNMVWISEENLFFGNIVFDNGFPKTTKTEKKWHGFGTKSISMIVKNYNGEMTFTAKNNVFTVSAVIPCPVSKK